MDKPHIDVAIITMKEEEYTAALDAFTPDSALLYEGELRDYDISRVETPRGPCHVAITRCIHQGNSQAQNAASHILKDLSPAFVMVVGIAGGVPTSDFTLGDVIVSNFIHDLTLEDTGTGTSRYNALGGPLHRDAARIVERLQAILGPFEPRIMAARPGFEGRHTTNNVEWNRDIDEAFRKHRENNRNIPKVRAERVVSSDRLVKDPELITIWRQVIKGIGCTEMESAGIYLECQSREIPFIAIRGISDIIGWQRDENWTQYACVTSAAYAAAIVSSGVFCRDKRRINTNESALQDYELFKRGAGSPADNVGILERIARSNDLNRNSYLEQLLNEPWLAWVEKHAIQEALERLSQRRSCVGLFDTVKQREWAKIDAMFPTDGDPVLSLVFKQLKYWRYLNRRTAPEFPKVEEALAFGLVGLRTTSELENLVRSLGG